MTVKDLFFFLIIIILPWELRQTIKRRHRRFLSKIQTVFKATLSFGQIKPEKIVFWIFGLKSFNKSTNNRSFPKGLVQAFCQKFELLSNFLVGKSSQKRSFLDSLDREHTF